jgi:cell wall-associated NlpC family hydrolase
VRLRRCIALATLDDFVKKALSQRGDPYVFGAEAAFSMSNPPRFDCSELVEWAAAQCGVRFVDGAQNQRDACRKAGTLLKNPKHGVQKRGALLFRIDEGPSNDHVAISLGNGQTIEARGSAYGVNVFSAHNRPWTHAGVVPGFEEEHDMTADELLDALQTPRGMKILRRVILTNPGDDPAPGSLFSKIRDIQNDVDRIREIVEKKP